MSESAAQARHGSVRSRIYRTLYDARDFVSRQSLAQSCGISMPTLYLNLNELMDEGLVCYSGEDRSTGGRRAQGLDIVPDARVSVGISVTEHHLRFVAADYPTPLGIVQIRHERQADGSRHPFDAFIVAKTPAARWGTTEDLMGPAVFLASDASNFVNGHVLYVDGGILAYIGKQP